MWFAINLSLENRTNLHSWGLRTTTLSPSPMTRDSRTHFHPHASRSTVPPTSQPFLRLLHYRIQALSKVFVRRSRSATLGTRWDLLAFARLQSKFSIPLRTKSISLLPAMSTQRQMLISTSELQSFSDNLSRLDILALRKMKFRNHYALLSYLPRSSRISVNSLRQDILETAEGMEETIFVFEVNQPRTRLGGNSDCS
jgi:hypothetical protein